MSDMKKYEAFLEEVQTQYEYKVVWVFDNITDYRLEEILNSYGEQCWELITAVHNVRIQFIFKRPKKKE